MSNGVGLDGRFVLNCLRVEFSENEIPVRVCGWDESTDMDDLQSRFGSDWFLYRKGNEVFGLATAEQPNAVFGETDRTLELTKYEGLDFTRARLNAVLPTLLPATIRSAFGLSAFLLKSKSSYIQSQVTGQFRLLLGSFLSGPDLS
jgi:hypothetical protein